MPDQPRSPADLFAAMAASPEQLFAPFMAAGGGTGETPGAQDLAQWTSVAQRLQQLWLDFQRQQMTDTALKLPSISYFKPIAFAGGFIQEHYRGIYAVARDPAAAVALIAAAAWRPAARDDRGGGTA